jgi:hypothetical protein
MSPIRAALPVAIGVLAASGALATASAPQRQVARAANTSGMTVTLTFAQTSAGTQHGQSTIGVKGHGTFSAKLGGHARDLALLAAVTGIPFGKIAHGGSFAAQFTIGAHGTNTGTVLARFKTKGLGSLCFGFAARGGQFQQGDSFVPTSGTIKLLGGTGEAARWHGGASFALTTIGGSTSTEKLTFTGTARGTVAARPHGLTAACKHA